MMERLTQKGINYCADICRSQTCETYHGVRETICGDAAIYEKLAAYEDAEEQGRLVVLPEVEGESMKEYIEREAAIAEIDDAFPAAPSSEFSKGVAVGVAMARLAACHLPAADVREVRRGRWIKADEQPYFRKKYHTMICSECGKRKDGKWNYCPNCGAEMKGEANHV